MSSSNQPVQGMSDIAAPEVRLWQRIEGLAREVFERYGFEELRTPAVEFESVFTRSIGETTDVVQKEMYVFEKGGRRLALRPEGTAGVMRHAAGRGAQETDGARWYYVGPMFRSERPQAGRRRQFHQCGVECLEPPSPLVDAEILALQVDLLRVWGLGDCEVRLNTRGEAGERSAVADGLRAALEARAAKEGISFYCPDFSYCTDNAAMVGSAAYVKLLDGRTDDLSLNAVPYLSIEEELQKTQ